MVKANATDVEMHGIAVLAHCADVWKPPYDKPGVELDDDVMHKYITTFVRTFVDEGTADVFDKRYHNFKEHKGENYGSN